MSIHNGGKNIFSNSIISESSRPSSKFDITTTYSVDFELEDEVFNIILCTENLKCILWKSRDGRTTRQPFLSSLGITVTDVIYEIPRKFRNCKVEKYAVMPNHVHIILYLTDVPALTEPIQYVKNIPIFIKTQSEEIARTRIWNEDHKCRRIKTRQEYDSIFLHTARNMLNWESDCYFRI